MRIKRLLLLSAITLGITLGAFSCGEMYSEIPEWSGSVHGIFVVYSGNGALIGSPPIDPATYIEGQEVAVLGNEGSLNRTGYTFIGWNTAPDGSGIPYIQGATFNIGAGTVTLYAQWSVNSYTLSYNANGNTSGAIPSGPVLYNYGQTVTVLGNTGDLRGQVIEAGITQRLTGWNTAANGSGAPYAFGDPLVMGAGDITLYAQWTTDASVIRKIGPAGGYIFYDKGSYSGTPPWRYLEAAPVDLGPGAFGCELQYLGAILKGYGDGLSNTDIIVAGCGEADILAKLCNNYSYNGYTDWYMPSGDGNFNLESSQSSEMHLIYHNLYKIGVGNFHVAGYYASTELQWGGQWYASIFDFTMPSNYIGGRNSSYYVRPVRRF